MALEKPSPREITDTDAALLAAAAQRNGDKAGGGIDDIPLGRIASFAEIANLDARGERHIRLLAPLDFLPPASLRRFWMAPRLRISRSSGLAKALSYSSAEQKRRIGLSL